MSSPRYSPGRELEVRRNRLAELELNALSWRKPKNDTDARFWRSVEHLLRDPRAERMAREERAWHEEVMAPIEAAEKRCRRDELEQLASLHPGPVGRILRREETW